jgi:probable HAF family extracellular repeat protein
VANLLAGLRENMQNDRSVCPAVLLSALVICTGIRAQAAEPPPPAYVITDLGTLGGTYSAATAINARGQVVGSASASGDAPRHAFVWTPTVPHGTTGTMRDIGTLGGPMSEAWGINAAGLVTGTSQAAGSDAFRSFLYDGTLKDLGTLGGPISTASDINDRGQVAGRSGDSGAFLYSGGVMRPMNGIGGPFSSAFGINAGGQVTGGAISSTGVDNAIRWTPTTPNGVTGTREDLGTLGGSMSFGHDINDRGQVTGYSLVAGDSWNHAFVYDNGTMKDLGAFSFSSNGTAINNGGQVVGSSDYIAFVYTPESGMVDLNSLIDPRLGWALGVAWDNNDAGQIVGWGFIDKEQHAFLMTPVPEPGALCLLGLGFVSLGRRRTRTFGLRAGNVVVA